MNYKETLFFVAKCLTINYEKENYIVIEKQLKSKKIDWDNVVKISTGYYMFPALYCNLKRAGFLHYVPNDLVDYMQHITDLNRERNQQIIEQAKEINELLLANNITPIFLKGSGNLLEGLYEDIAERMVGDIDFLVKKEDCKIVYTLLKENGYTSKKGQLYEDHKHLPRMTKLGKIAAIEIHKEMLREEKSSFFNYSTIKDSLINRNNYFLLSYKNQIKLTIFSKLINDYQYLKKGINLRAAYDYFLLGNKLDARSTFKDKYLNKELIAGLSLYSYLLSKPTFVVFNSTTKSKNFINKTVANLNNSYKVNFNKKITSFYIGLLVRVKIVARVFYKKSNFIFVFSRITNMNWYKEKLIQLGLKKLN